ncbi:MAG: EAL domain-containing protein [Betaproteobacteria bacterium]
MTQGLARAYSLRERLSFELMRLMRSYVLAAGFLVSAAALALSYYYKQVNLSHQSELAASELVQDVGNLLQQTQALGSSSVLWTGLSDSVGRSIYLEPLLKQFNALAPHQLMLLDYRGRLLMAPEPALAERLLASAPVVQALNGSALRYGFVSEPAGDSELFVYIRPIYSPLVTLPVGFIVGSINLRESIKGLALGQTAVSLSLGDEVPAGAVSKVLTLKHEKTAWISGDGQKIPLHIQLAQPLWDILLVLLALLAMTLLLSRWILLRVRFWTQGFAANTTERLDQLVLYCQNILAGQLVSPVQQEHEDEISQVFKTLGQMLVQQKEVTDELRTSSLVFMTAAEAILVTDKEGKIVEINPALARMTGYSRSELMGQLAGTLYRPIGNGDAPAAIQQTLNSQKVWQGETFFVHRDGSQIPTTTAISHIVDDSGQTTGRVAVITDVSKLKQAEDKLRFLAYHDALTGLPNFRQLTELAQRRFDTSSAQPGSTALLFMDMDRLKALNDNYGHEIGDVVIQAIAKHLSARLPAGHVLCRRSGDEFIALVDIPADMSLASLRSQFFTDLNQLVIRTDVGLVAASVSVGVARYGVDAENFNALMICADIALNEVKKTHRGSVIWYDEAMGRKLHRANLIQAKLPQALSEQVLQVHYQPEVDMRSGELIGLEALLRWTDPELGVIAPTEFIGIAEELHLAEQVALYVFHQIMADRAAIRQRFAGAVIAINVAPQAFRDFRLFNAITEQMENQPDSLLGLEIEITESDIAHGEQNLMQQLQMLAGIGVPLVIDDFGMGYSSLSRLSSFPIRRLKIDRHFVAGMEGEQGTRIVEVLIQMASALGLQVTAEGIQTQAQRQQLIALGCHRAQGWLYARAMPLDQLLRLPVVLPMLAPDKLDLVHQD